MSQYIEKLDPHRKAQMDSLLKATSGAKIFIILAGGFPADDVTQGAFLALANDVLPDRYQVLRELYSEEKQCQEIIAMTNHAHRHLEAFSYTSPGDSLDVPPRLAATIIGRAISFENHLNYLPEIINTYDRSKLRESRVRVGKALLNLIGETY